MNNQTSNSFLPTSYEVPKTGGNYLKLKEGDNIFRILSSAVIGWEDWVEESVDGKLTKKPVRTPYIDPQPQANRADRPVKHFWAMICWDYLEKKLKILEITQVSIQEVIKNLIDDVEWGSPLNYDINIKRTGKDMETKYSVIARPPKPLHPEIARIFKETPIDLNKLFTGEDPFASADTTQQNAPSNQPDDYIPDEDVQSVPF